jgi:hypothetical protein
MIAGKRKRVREKTGVLQGNQLGMQLTHHSPSSVAVAKMFKASVGVCIQSIAIHLDESESDKWTSDLLVRTYLRSLATQKH